MCDQRAEGWTRRRFLGGLTLAGTAGLLSLHARPVTAEPPPETTKLTLVQVTGLCVAPQYVAEELLAGEGFTDVRYLQTEGGDEYRILASGEAQISMAFVAPFIMYVDTGHPIVLLGGVHVGCFEVFGTDQVRTIRDLKGKTVAVPDLGSAHHVFLASMVAYVGLDPQKDINWTTHPLAESAQLLATGKVDALVGFPPVPQELRAKGIGHVVVNSGLDRPWSQYFCCMVVGHREFVRTHPVAAKRALRAILKATDVCALEPDRAARSLVDKGLVQNYDYALQTMQEVPYNRWREYDPEDTVRFYALRLHEIGLIKSTPQKIIAQGTDWRFFNELKKELKG
jgi:NitT/TauT family transport system substrate-binding protein